jgi:hypothetical protein
MGVEAEELVVQLTNLNQPQRRKRTGRHPGLGLGQQRRRDARFVQHGGEPLG